MNDYKGGIIAAIIFGALIGLTGGISLTNRKHAREIGQFRSVFNQSTQLVAEVISEAQSNYNHRIDQLESGCAALLVEHDHDIIIMKQATRILRALDEYLDTYDRYPSSWIDSPLISTLTNPVTQHQVTVSTSNEHVSPGNFGYTVNDSGTRCVMTACLSNGSLIDFITTTTRKVESVSKGY